MSKYMEYLVQLLELFKVAPSSLTEDEGQILLRLIRKAHREHKEDLEFILNPPENKELIPTWLRECKELDQKHTGELWTKYYQLILEIDQQTIRSEINGS